VLEQNEFKQCLLSFDDNKILKDQLDMLIFFKCAGPWTKIYNVLIKVLVMKEQI